MLLSQNFVYCPESSNPALSLKNIFLRSLSSWIFCARSKAKLTKVHLLNEISNTLFPFFILFRQNSCVVTRGAFLDVLVCLCGPKISLLDGEQLLWGHFNMKLPQYTDQTQVELIFTFWCIWENSHTHIVMVTINILYMTQTYDLRPCFQCQQFHSMSPTKPTGKRTRQEKFEL